MTTDTDAIRALLEKVETATKASRELDAEIDAALRIGTVMMRVTDSWVWNNFPAWRSLDKRPGHCCVVMSDGSDGVWWESYRFTSDVQDVLRVANDRLPEWNWSSAVDAHGERWFVMENADGEETPECYGATDALGLLASIIRALLAQEGE